MKNLPMIILAFCLSACGTEPSTYVPEAKSPVSAPQVAQEPRAEAPRFSFDEIAEPSLIEINNGRFRKDLGDRRYALTNVDNSFEQLFTIIFDAQRGMHIIQDKQSRVFFDGRVDGVPRYAASLDIDANGLPDVLLHLSAYGNHGNGRELFELYLNENGRLIPQENPVAIEFNAGQEDRAGKLTWLSDPAVTAIFDGEEAKFFETPGGGVQVNAVARIHEVWGHKDGAMRLLSKTSTPIQVKDVQLLTFR